MHTVSQKWQQEAVCEQYVMCLHFISLRFLQFSVGLECFGRHLRHIFDWIILKHKNVQTEQTCRLKRWLRAKGPVKIINLQTPALSHWKQSQCYESKKKKKKHMSLGWGTLTQDCHLVFIAEIKRQQHLNLTRRI